MSAHTNLLKAAAELDWGFDCTHLRYSGGQKIVLTKGSHLITVYLSDERVRSAFKRRDPGQMHDLSILGGQKAIIKIMKEA